MENHVIPNIEAEDFVGDDGEEGKILSFKSCVKLVTVALFFKERRMAPLKKKLREQRRKFLFGTTEPPKDGKSEPREPGAEEILQYKGSVEYTLTADGATMNDMILKTLKAV